jgi:hypothetical protein
MISYKVEDGKQAPPSGMIHNVFLYVLYINLRANNDVPVSQQATGYKKNLIHSLIKAFEVIRFTT